MGVTNELPRAVQAGDLSFPTSLPNFQRLFSDERVCVDIWCGCGGRQDLFARCAVGRRRRFASRCVRAFFVAAYAIVRLR